MKTSIILFTIIAVLVMAKIAFSIHELAVVKGDEKVRYAQDGSGYVIVNE